MQLAINYQRINTVCQQEDIAYLGLFGSQARGDATTASDVDILVDFNHTKSYFQLARVQEKFEQMFDKKVDLVLKTALKESLRPYILKDLIKLYGKE